MTVTTVLGLILMVCLVAVAGLRGLGVLISLILNLGVLLVAVTLVSLGFNPWWVLLLSSIILLTVITLSAGAEEQTTFLALRVSLIVLAIVLVLLIPAEHFAQASGFSVANSEELEALSLGISISFPVLGIFAAVLATIGAIAEAAIAIASSLAEITEEQPEATFEDLLPELQAAGGQIIGTAVNTVLFGFMADFLTIALWFGKVNYTLADMINAKVFVAALLACLYAILGVILVLPVFIQCYRWQRRK